MQTDRCMVSPEAVVLRVSCVQSALCHRDACGATNRTVDVFTLPACCCPLCILRCFTGTRGQTHARGLPEQSTESMPLRLPCVQSALFHGDACEAVGEDAALELVDWAARRLLWLNSHAGRAFARAEGDICRRVIQSGCH